MKVAPTYVLRTAQEDGVTMRRPEIHVEMHESALQTSRRSPGDWAYRAHSFVASPV